MNFEAVWQQDIENKTLYPKRVTNDVALIVQQIQPQIAEAFYKTKKAVFHLKFFHADLSKLDRCVLGVYRSAGKNSNDQQNEYLFREFAIHGLDFN